MEKMDTKIGRKWVKALRSGKYLQGKGKLESEDSPPKYCCLGVLCEVTNSWVRDRNGTLTSSQLCKFGLSDGAQSELIRRNDSYSHSFEKIADYVEANLLPPKRKTAKKKK